MSGGHDSAVWAAADGNIARKLRVGERDKIKEAIGRTYFHFVQINFLVKLGSKLHLG